MEYTKLGQTDIEISRICIGGMSFGKVFPDFHQWVIDQPATQAVIKEALSQGINFIDTANVYAHGTSEEFIGRAVPPATEPAHRACHASCPAIGNGAFNQKAEASMALARNAAAPLPARAS